jgi:hypothetical protein
VREVGGRVWEAGGLAMAPGWCDNAPRGSWRYSWPDAYESVGGAGAGSEELMREALEAGRHLRLIISHRPAIPHV